MGYVEGPRGVPGGPSVASAQARRVSKVRGSLGRVVMSTPLSTFSGVGEPHGPLVVWVN